MKTTQGYTQSQNPPPRVVNKTCWLCRWILRNQVNPPFAAGWHTPPPRDVHTIGIRAPAIRNKTCIPCTISAIAQNTQSQKRGSFAETAAEQAEMLNISPNNNYAKYCRKRWIPSQKKWDADRQTIFLPKCYICRRGILSIMTKTKRGGKNPHIWGKLVWKLEYYLS